MAANEGKPGVDTNQRVVGDIAEHRHPPVITGDLVEFVAMDEQEAAPVGSGVYMVVAELDIAEGGTHVLAQRLVMIPRDEHHLGALARRSQHFLHHGVLGGVQWMLRFIAQKSMMSPTRKRFSAS